MIIIFCFFVLLICFAFYTKKFRNPYTLTFVFGKKGSGKSCFLIHEMKKHLRSGWNVYTDMQDCLLEGVRIIDSRQLSDFIPIPHSLLCLDEVGITYDARDFKSFPKGLRDFYKFQRKYKCKIIMNSQAFDVDKKIRDVVDSMILQTSILGCISFSRPIKRTITLTEPDGEQESRIADKLKFESIFRWKFYWMPRYFKYFDSFDAPVKPEIPFRTSFFEIGERSGSDEQQKGSSDAL